MEGGPQRRGEIAVGSAIVDCMAPVSQAGPPFGGQMPCFTESARMAARASRLAKGQIWVNRGAPSSAYMATTRGESFTRAGMAACQAAIVGSTHRASAGRSGFRRRCRRRPPQSRQERERGVAVEAKPDERLAAVERVRAAE